MTALFREFEHRKTWIGGLPIYAVKREEFACEFLQDLASNEVRNVLPKLSTSANGHVLALAEHKPEFRALLMQADHIDADGMPLGSTRKSCTGRHRGAGPPSSGEGGASPPSPDMHLYIICY